MHVKKLIILASGGGTNAANIIDYFSKNNKVKVAWVISNNANAGVLEKANQRNVATKILDKKQDFVSDVTLQFLQTENPDLIVLAGFLWLIPKQWVNLFKNKIINIHPSLLPNYGGKGMYGMHVHQAVIKAKEKESGITIHYVNEHFDEGEIIFQEKCTIHTSDTPEDLEKKIRHLEHTFYPQIIDKLLNN